MDLEKLCRTCLQSGGKLYSLFDTEIDDYDLHRTAPIELLRLTSIKITDENEHPNQICSACLFEVERICNFRLECETSEEILKKLKNLEDPANIKWDDEHDDSTTDSIGISDEVSETKDEVKDVILSKELASTDQPYKFEEINVLEIVKEESELNVLSEDIEEMYDSDVDEKSVPINKAILRRLRCNACEMECASTKCFARHIRNEHMKGNTCQICNIALACNSLKHYTKHLTLRYTLEKYPEIINKGICHCLPIAHAFSNRPQNGSTCPSSLLSCSLCSKDLKKADVLLATKAENSDTLHCNRCTKTFMTIDELFGHIQQHVTLQQFVCEFCFKNFTRKHNLEYHRKLHTGDTLDTGDTRDIRDAGDTRDTAEKLWRCAYCPMAFNKKDAMLSHAGHKHYRNKHQKRYECHTCKKTFWYKGSYMTHLKSSIHKNGKPRKGNRLIYRCYICLEGFQFRACLFKHIKMKHELK